MRIVLQCLAIGVLAGCYNSHIVVAPPAPPGVSAFRSPSVDHAKHVSALGALEVSDAKDFGAACPGASHAVVIHERVGFIDGLLSSLASTVVPGVDIRDVSIDCQANPPAPLDGPPGGISQR